MRGRRAIKCGNRLLGHWVVRPQVSSIKSVSFSVYFYLPDRFLFLSVSFSARYKVFARLPDMTFSSIVSILLQIPDKFSYTGAKVLLPHAQAQERFLERPRLVRPILKVRTARFYD